MDQKNEEMPKNSHFFECFGVFEELNLFHLNFAVAFKLYVSCSFFADQDGWEAEKSCNSVQSGFFVSKMLIFHQITKFFWGKCVQSKRLEVK